MPKIICIDAGHGGKDSGAVNGSRYEKNDNLRFSKALEKELIDQGFKVIQTRKDDSFVSLQQRSDYANKNRADFFISIHRNSFINSTANGVENWVYQNTDSQTKLIAQKILDEIYKVGVQSKRGLKEGNYHVVRETNMPACLLELCFISNQQDNVLYDKNFEGYARAITKAICSFYHQEYKEITDEKPIEEGDSNRLYRVQVGAFKNRENAVMLMEAVKKDGYQAFIV